MITLTTHNHFGDHVIMTAVLANAHAASIQCNILSSPYDQLFTDVTTQPQQLIKVQYSQSQRDGKLNCVEGFTQNLSQQLNTDIPCKYTKPLLTVDNVEQGDYWILQAGYQVCATVKNFSRAQWQQLVDTFKDVHFKQVGICDSRNIQPMLYGVENLVNKTTLPELIKLYAGCKGVIGPVSSCTHLAAAFNKPCICIIGNRQSKALTDYGCVHHCGSACTLGPCMAFYSFGQRKACTKPAVVGSQVIPACMCCLKEVEQKLKELL